MRGFRLLQESILKDNQNTGFIPFVDERDQIGNLKGAPPRTTSRVKRKLVLPERKKSQTAKPSLREKKTQFLKEIYSTHQSAWNTLTNIRVLDNKLSLKLDTQQEEQKPLVMLNKNLKLNDYANRKNIASIPTSPRLGRYKTISMIPPLGYYQVKDIQKKSPMLVKMEASSTPRVIKEFNETPKEKKELQASKNTSIHLSNQTKYLYGLDQRLIDKAYETERNITNQRYKQMPQHLDLRNLEESSNKIKMMRLKIKQFKTQNIN